MYGKEYYDEMNKKEARKQRWEKAKFPVAVILVALVLVGVAMYTNVIPNPFVKAPVDLPMTDDNGTQGDPVDDPTGPVDVPAVNPEAPAANMESGGQEMGTREDGSMDVTPDERDLPTKETKPADPIATPSEGEKASYTWTTNESGASRRNFASADDLIGVEPIKPFENVYVNGELWGWSGTEWIPRDGGASVEETTIGGLSGELIGH